MIYRYQDRIFNLSNVSPNPPSAFALATASCQGCALQHCQPSCDITPCHELAGRSGDTIRQELPVNETDYLDLSVCHIRLHVDGRPPQCLWLQLNSTGKDKASCIPLSAGLIASRSQLALVSQAMDWCAGADAKDERHDGGR
jgi:hypothetical protein